MGGQTEQKFECNDKHIDIQSRLRESRTEGFTRLPSTPPNPSKMLVSRADTEKAAEPKNARPLFTERTSCQEKEKSA